jgi:transcriptional regulator with PAS, ATPase and Fis domain
MMPLSPGFEPRKTFDTSPRVLVRREGDGEARIAVLILAGNALRFVPATSPRTLVLNSDLEIGRDRPNAWLCSDVDDALMSRHHARITRAPTGDYFVCDLGSTNGTWLDGILVPTGMPRKLLSGSVLMMGGHVFVFRLVSEVELSAMREDWAAPFAPVPTLSPAMALVVRKFRQLARANIDMLLTGETGVGKEVHAEAIHRASGRKGPFVPINCAAIPEDLVESELFGYARGAHSTADRPKPGLIEQAEGGTLFLDEIGEMSYSAQTKLLRFLQDRQLLSLGTTRARTLDVRILAATHRTVAHDHGTAEALRYDLAARLGPEPLGLPPLRDRVEDIGMLTAFFTKDSSGFVPEAYLSLFLHSWAGNVRELEKVVTVAGVLADRSAIDLDHLPRPVAARLDSNPSRLPVRRRRPTRDELMTLLSRHGGDVAQLARELGRQRTLVWRWLRENQLWPNDFRG